MSSPGHPGVDLGALYRSARERISALVTTDGIDPDRVVPATPEWTVQNVVGHLSGIAADAVNGNMTGAPGDEWTAAQVDRNRGRSIADLVQEWSQFGPLMEGVLSGQGGAMSGAAVMDIHTHEADLRHALGLPFDVPAEFIAWAGPVMRSGFQQQVAAAGLEPVDIDVDDVTLFRARFGRRTDDEVRAYCWSLDPSPYLGTFFIFGRAARSLREGE